MKIHEYQAKDILANHGVAVQPGVVATTVEEAVEAAGRVAGETGRDLFVVKAQVLTGGRGKAGGDHLDR